MGRTAFITLACALAVSATVPARAHEGLVPAAVEAPAFLLPASNAAPAGRFVSPPLAARVFCIQYKTECLASEPARIVLDAKASAGIEAINRGINAAIKPVRELPGRDVWKLHQPEGDCDEYAVQKRHELIKAGFPASALLLAWGHRPDGEAHLVLMIVTDAGDYVLDNMTNEIKPWRDAGLHFAARQSRENPRWWQALAPPNPVVIWMAGLPALRGTL